VEWKEVERSTDSQESDTSVNVYKLLLYIHYLKGTLFSEQLIIV